MIEVELNQLRHDFTAVSAKLERLVGLVSSCRGPSSRRSPSHSKLPPVRTRFVSRYWMYAYLVMDGGGC